jgi:hypothetical protein
MSSDRWYTQLRAGEQEIEWTTQGDPLVEYIRQAMPMSITLTNWLAPNQEQPPDPMMSDGRCLYSDTVPSRLIFAYFVDGIRVLVETKQRVVSESDLEPWKSAFEQACARLFEDEPKYEWWSVIGTRRGMIADVPKLVEGGTIGDIAIEAAAKECTEALDLPSNPSLGGANIFSSFPVVVRGKSAGYNWNVASQRATIDLNAICALFSLAFDSCWSVRLSPSPDEGQKIELPTRGYGLSEQAHLHPVLGGTREVRIPSWMNRAKEIVGANDVFSGALHAHRQGLSLIEEHPSLPLVCFVSVIEAVGSTLVELTLCGECGSRTGAQRRFRKALKTVLTNRQMSPLLNAYNLRSQTVHSGILHGNETSMGSFSIPHEVFAGSHPSMNFRYQTLWDMQEASRRVLLKQLSG